MFCTVYCSEHASSDVAMFNPPHRQGSSLEGCWCPKDTVDAEVKI